MKLHWSAILGTALLLLQAGMSFGQRYEPHKDSIVREEVPKGTVTEHTWNTSKVFPGTTRNYWVYVPAQYTPDEPACLMVFQDGGLLVDPDGDISAALELTVRIPTVFDNLIHQGAMPVSIGIFVDPGMKQDEPDQRSVEYGSIGDAYARFLLEEIIAEVGSEYALTDQAEGRAICGFSSGGVCAFIAAWERPDLFSKVITFCASYVNRRGAGRYQQLVRESKGAPKPLRLFLQTGEEDLHIVPSVNGKDLSDLPGDWRIGNLTMSAALEYAGYDFEFVMGTGGHELSHASHIFPDVLRWIWRDYPGVTASGDLSFQPREAESAPSIEGMTLTTTTDGVEIAWTFGEHGALSLSAGEFGGNFKGDYAQYGTDVFIFVPGKSIRAIYNGDTLIIS